jgi:hypothetical protein
VPASFGFRSRRSDLVSVTPASRSGDRGFSARFRTEGRDTVSLYATCIEGTSSVTMRAGGRGAMARGAGVPTDQIVLGINMVQVRRPVIQTLGTDFEVLRAPIDGRGATVIGGLPPLPTANLDKVRATGFMPPFGDSLEGLLVVERGAARDLGVFFTIITARGPELELRNTANSIAQSLQALGQVAPGLGGSPVPGSTPPSPGTPPAGGAAVCSDGIDNDSDMTTDLNDFGCTGPTDDDEEDKTVVASFPCPGEGVTDYKLFQNIFFPDGTVERHEFARNPVLHTSPGEGPHGPLDLGTEPCGPGTSTMLYDGKNDQAPTLGVFPPLAPPPAMDGFRFAAEIDNPTGSGNSAHSVPVTSRIAYDPPG